MVAILVVSPIWFLVNREMPYGFIGRAKHINFLKIQTGLTTSGNDITFAILAGVSALVGLLAWFFPIPPGHTEPLILPYAGKLVRRSFRMGDEAAANFPYITTPIQDIYNKVIQTLLDASDNAASAKHGILILGEANAGKTRLAFESLAKALPDWHVLIWSPAYTISEVPAPTALHGHDLVIFIDNLQEYVPAESPNTNLKVFVADNHTIILQALLNRVREAARHVVILATCRTENEVQVRASLGQLFNELMVVRLLPFPKDIHDPKTAEIISVTAQVRSGSLK